MSEEACTCLTVRYRPIEHADGTRSARWQCAKCRAGFYRASGAGERLLRSSFGDMVDRSVYDVVRYLGAAENEGLTPAEVAPKLADWAGSSSGPAEVVYAAAARALAEPLPEDPSTLDRPEREVRRVPKRPTDTAKEVLLKVKAEAGPLDSASWDHELWLYRRAVDEALEALK